MKTKISHVLLVVSALLLGGCNDYLELLPTQDLVQDEFWQTEGDLESVMAGAYSNFGKTTKKLFEYGEIRADMIEDNLFGDKTQIYRDIINGDIEPTDSYYSWTEFYATINLCNYVLEYAPLVYSRDETFDEFRYKGFISEALFLRSLTYFYLVRFWKDVPLVLISSKNDQQNLFPAKSTENEILTTILTDLETARFTVRDSYAKVDESDVSITSNAKGRASLNAILSLIADIYLWKEDYQKCVDYLSLIDESKNYLMTTSEWFEIFYPGGSPEGIFEVYFDQSLNQTAEWVKGINHDTGLPNLFLPTTKAINLMYPPYSGEFIRGYGSVYNDFFLSSIWKYTAQAGTAARDQRPASEIFSANFIVYRVADIKLMAAEAYNQLGDQETALTLVNEIRNRANMPILPRTSSMSELEKIILEERALELAFEGKRWFDVMRYGRRNNYQNKSALIDLMVERTRSVKALTLRIKYKDPHSWYWPINQSELELNDNLVQNPYYEYLSSK